jgi:hypothetical protein
MCDVLTGKCHDTCLIEREREVCLMERDEKKKKKKKKERKKERKREVNQLTSL